MLAHPSPTACTAISTDASDCAVGAVYEQWVSVAWQLLTFCLSRADVGAVPLGLDYAHIVADQTTAPDVQLLGPSTTGLQIEVSK